MSTTSLPSFFRSTFDLPGQFPALRLDSKLMLGELQIAKSNRRAMSGSPVRELVKELYYGLANPGPVGLKGSQFLMAG